MCMKSKAKKKGNSKSTTKSTKGRRPAKILPAALSDQELIALARTAVSDRANGTPRVVRPAAALALARKNIAEGSDVASDVAKLVGAKLPAEDASAAGVEFVTETPLGKRSTMVHVRGNKVTSVVTRASR
jgi:hypothetical protein